jgi:hypothetical protein
MRIRSLDVGVEAISRFLVEDDVHLPEDKGLRPAFLPVARPLDDVLKRPSLDERLPQLLQPDYLDSDLLEPATLTSARLATCQVLAECARRESGSRRKALELATAYLDDTAHLDDEVRRSLAALLRG